MSKELNIKGIRIKDEESLLKYEKEIRKKEDLEGVAFAKATSFKELVNTVVPDKNGPWKSPLYYIISNHQSTTGASNLILMATKFLKPYVDNGAIDTLSISSNLEHGILYLKMLIRAYGKLPDFAELFKLTGDPLYKEDEDNSPKFGKLVVPDEVKNNEPTEEDIEKQKKAYAEQRKEHFETATAEHPYLNQLGIYVPQVIRRPEDSIALIYDLKTRDMNRKTRSSYYDFEHVFESIMRVVNGTEYNTYINSIDPSVVQDAGADEKFMNYLKNAIIIPKYVEQSKLPPEDVKPLMDKLYNALYKLYIVQDFIDDPNVTDIKITAPDSIRVRVHGKAYLSNVHFIDVDDYLRFVNSIAVRNGISEDVPEQTFTDNHDETYILRFSITEQFVNSVPFPYLHIRKVSRVKPLGDKLIELGMLTPRVRDYLLDCGRKDENGKPISRGVVFAGPPGSGKTVALNWFLEEAYEQSAEILVIQENEELFAYRKGVMFQHTVNYATRDHPAVSLEQLGQLALVAGANVFIIGETKGAEICSAITLSNSGCRTAMTIHSPSSTETIDKMADLAMRGYAKDFIQAKRQLKAFQTIVYLQDFHVQEISEITGFDEERQDMTYKYIYKRELDPDAKAWDKAHRDY